jgi:hypothetical protein
VPLTVSTWLPPVPVVVLYTFVQVLPLADTWIWNDFAYAASQLSSTPQTLCEVPRSTCSHCGSANALAHRVAALPSTAALAGVVAFSADEAVAV